MWPYVTTIDLEQDNNWYDTFGQKEWDKTDYDGKYSIAIFAIAMFLREGVNGKKNVFFRALPEFPKPPPPHDPNSGNLVLFFRKSKFKIWKSV